MSNQNSRSGTPTFNNDANKRKMYTSMPSDLTASENSNSPVSTPAKKPKTEMSTSSLPSSFSGVVSSGSKE